MSEKSARDRLRTYLSQLESNAGAPESKELSEALIGSLATIQDHFGDEHVLMRRLSTITFPNPRLERWNAEQYRSDHTRSVEAWCGALRAALSTFEDAAEEPLVDSAHIDSGLWRHVRASVEAQEWGHVATLTAVYVEDRIRSWAGLERDMVGFVVMGKAFADGGPLVLGETINERKSWRDLAVGFVGALSNVDRHHVQSRVDMKTYALGVMGTGSLLLTQVKFEYPDLTVV